MALNANELGADLKQRADNFNEIDIDNIDEARLNFWTSIAEGIINHFKNNGEVLPGSFNVPSAGGVVGEGAIQ